MKEKLSAFYAKDSTQKVVASLLSILIGLVVGSLVILIVGLTSKSISTKGAWEGIRLVFGQNIVQRQIVIQFRQVKVLLISVHKNSNLYLYRCKYLYRYKTQTGRIPGQTAGEALDGEALVRRSVVSVLRT